MKKICFITSAEIVVHFFLIEPLRVLSREYDVCLVVNTDNPHFLDRYGLGKVRVIPLAIEREIHPWVDLHALLSLIRLFRRERFAVIHSITPKAGLLAVLAGVISGTHIRIHNLSGQVWVTKRGVARWVLKELDRFTASMATHLLSDSQSQIHFLLSEKVLQAEKVRVLGAGSVAGVNVQKFRINEAIRMQVRGEMDTAPDAKVILFLGRIKRDKGVLDLVQAFKGISEKDDRIWLWIVGPDEDELSGEIKAICRGQLDRVRMRGYTTHVERYMASADLFCLPSYRESFGVSILEAAACGVPAVASRIYGITDAIVDGVSGKLFEAGNISSLRECLTEMLNSDELRNQLGEAAYHRVHAEFTSEHITGLWVSFYESLLKRS